MFVICMQIIRRGGKASADEHLQDEVFFAFFDHAVHQQGEQQGQQDALVPPVYAVIETHVVNIFRTDEKEQDPHAVAQPAVRIVKAFADHVGEEREGDPAYCKSDGHGICRAAEKDEADVVYEHGQAGDEL